MREAQEGAARLQAEGARLIRRKHLKALDIVISVFRLKETDTLEFIENTTQQAPELELAPNHYYRPLSNEDANQPYFEAVGLDASKSCARPLRLGLIDGPVETGHEAFKDKTITVKQIISKGRKTASARHATAIASLWLGQPRTKQRGLSPNAHVFNAVVMEQASLPHASVENIAIALDWLLQQDIDAINLSFGGPDNRLLKRVAEKSAQKVPLVASAGNTGRTEPIYPAAYEQVIAVSAIDSRGRAARDATKGDFIDLAAPGVDLWLADADGGSRYISGSSMAAPWVTVAAALNTEGPEVLYQHAKDLGPSGKDNTFGWGLVRLNHSCTIAQQ